jgi:hypothetical protein
MVMTWDMLHILVRERLYCLDVFLVVHVTYSMSLFIFRVWSARAGGQTLGVPLLTYPDDNTAHYNATFEQKKKHHRSEGTFTYDRSQLHIATINNKID